jgi:hypothetical protein
VRFIGFDHKAFAMIPSLKLSGFNPAYFRQVMVKAIKIVKLINNKRAISKPGYNGSFISFTINSNSFYEIFT